MAYRNVPEISMWDMRTHFAEFRKPSQITSYITSGTIAHAQTAGFTVTQHVSIPRSDSRVPAAVLLRSTVVSLFR